MKRVVLFLFTFFAFSQLFADVPNEIVYQGKLKEYGVPVNGSRTITFEIYPLETGGTADWSSGPQSIMVSSGIFSYTLSPDIEWRNNNGNYWIQLTVNSKILSPREKLGAQAYALHSRTAEDIEKSVGQNIHFAIGGSTIASIKSDGNIKNFVPTGAILPYGGTTAPTGWLLCDGQSISRTTYSDLFAVIGTSFGSEDGLSFNVPDLRGRFLRGRDGGTGRDPDSGSRTAMNLGGSTGDSIGSIQTDQIISHSHPLDVHGAGPANSGVSIGDSVEVTGMTGATGGNETRPKNAYVSYIIKH